MKKKNKDIKHNKFDMKKLDNKLQNKTPPDPLGQQPPKVYFSLLFLNHEIIGKDYHTTTLDCTLNMSYMGNYRLNMT